MAGQRDYLSYLQFSPERPSKQFEWTLLVPPHEGVPRVVPIPSCIIQPIQPTILPAQPSGRAPEQTHPQAPARLKPCKTSSFPPTRLTIRQRGLLHLKLGESNLEMKRKLGKSPCLGSTCSTLDLGGVLFKDFGMLRFTLYTTYVILPVVSATGWVSTPRVRRVSVFRVPNPIHWETYSCKCASCISSSTASERNESIPGIPMSHYDQTPLPTIPQWKDKLWPWRAVEGPIGLPTKTLHCYWELTTHYSKSAYICSIGSSKKR